jgi:RHS repeat-associated protein
LSKIVGGTTFTNTIASTSNRYAQMQSATGTISPQYDLAGNMTNDGTSTFAYSDRGRLSTANTPSGTVMMSYNALEQRAYKASALGTSYYVRDEEWNFIGEYDATGTAVYEVIYLGTIPVGVVKQSNVYNVYADQISTPRLITKQDQTIVWRWDSAEAFGATLPVQDPAGLGIFNFNLCMLGQVRDAETGLCDNGYRIYDPLGGRYLQFDPLGLQGGSASPYSYADGAPTQLTDLQGLTTFMCTKPLHALGDKWGPRLYPESRFNPSPLYHQYMCVPDGKGGMACGGQDRGEGPFGPGKPSTDSFSGGVCKPADENKCVEKCVLREIGSPNRPPYALAGGIGGGVNCQQWADQKLKMCQQECKGK